MTDWISVDTAASISALVAERRKHKANITNFFFASAVFAEAAEEGRLFTLKSRPGSLFRMIDGNVCRIYFTATSLDELAVNMSEVRGCLDGRCVIDIIGRKTDIENICNGIEEIGFEKYKIFQRMSRVPEKISQQTSRCDFINAPIGTDLLQDVYTTIIENFDPLSEHIISKRQLHELNYAGTIIISVDGNGALKGFLVHQQTGATNILRYLFVAEECRGTGLGKALIAQYIGNTTTTKRYDLWVWDKNEPALKNYTGVGYQPDGYVDNIFLFSDT